MASAAGDGVGRADLQLLLWARADLEARDEKGHTALAKAATYGQMDCLKALLDLKAVVDASDEVDHSNLFDPMHTDTNKLSQTHICFLDFSLTCSLVSQTNLLTDE